jgi:PKD domain
LLVALALTLAALLLAPSALAADSIYWTNNAGGAIRVANLDGSGSPANLFSGESGPRGVAIDPAAGKIYWSNLGSGAIRVANLDGSGSPASLFSGESQPFGVAIDPAAGKIYWANFNGNAIRVANLDGTGSASDLFSGESQPGGVAIDPAAGKIYWASISGGAIRVANLDGSGSAANLFSGESGPAFAALLRTPAGTGAPVISGGGEVGQQLSCSQGSWAANLLGAFLFRAPRSFAYQWQQDGSDIGAASSSTYTPTEPGSYSCRVTATNQAGSAAQTSAPVSVAQPPCKPVSSAAANYTPQQSVPGRRVPGVRARLSVAEPSQLQIHAMLGFRQASKGRSVDLGDRSLADPGTRNLRLPLPAPLRSKLALGTKVRLALQISSTPDSSPGCRGATSTDVTLHTRVVKVLAAPQSRAGQ